MLLPKTTTSAALANSSDCYASTDTPFIEVTDSLGQVICTFQPLDFMRFNIPKAINESNSLNPSKVRIEIFTGLNSIREAKTGSLTSDQFDQLEPQRNRV